MCWTGTMGRGSSLSFRHHYLWRRWRNHFGPCACEGGFLGHLRRHGTGLETSMFALVLFPHFHSFQLARCKSSHLAQVCRNSRVTTMPMVSLFLGRLKHTFSRPQLQLFRPQPGIGASTIYCFNCMSLAHGTNLFEAFAVLCSHAASGFVPQ